VYTCITKTLCNVYHYTGARQHFAALLDEAKKQGVVCVKKRNGESFYIRSATTKKSPLDIEGVDLDISSSEIVDIIREGRERNYGSYKKINMSDILVDSNVILDVLEDDPNWYNWSVEILEKYSASHRLVINSIAYAEISIGFERIEELEDALNAGEFNLAAIPKEALFLAGKAFLKYRRQKGLRVSSLPDFYIGAHAAVAGMNLLTRDTKRVVNYFPSVKLVSPSK
jgi:predicted nucleic acid-binding protein/PHD/YefM family antitoxin component YafN of YafNO toxin-antitoxin module